MSEQFELPVSFKGEKWMLPAEFMNMGYTHRIKITVNGITLLFEPDEEKNYRAILDNTEKDGLKAPDREFIKKISETLHSLFA
jgi:hypothetical protein